MPRIAKIVSIIESCYLPDHIINVRKWLERINMIKHVETVLEHKELEIINREDEIQWKE